MSTGYTHYLYDIYTHLGPRVMYDQCTSLLDQYNNTLKFKKVQIVYLNTSYITYCNLVPSSTPEQYYRLFPINKDFL